MLEWKCLLLKNKIDVGNKITACEKVLESWQKAIKDGSSKLQKI